MSYGTVGSLGMTSMSTPTAQANVVAQVYPDVHGLNMAMNNQQSLFVTRGTVGRDEYFGIRMNEMVFSLKSDMKSSSRRKNPLMSRSNGLVRSALNGLRFDEDVQRLIDRLVAIRADPEIIRSVAMRQIQIIGLAFQKAYDHDSSLYGDRKDLNFAVYMSGVIMVPVRKYALSIGDRVRWTIPLEQDYSQNKWFNSKIDGKLEGKIGLFAEPVDPAVDFKRTAAGVAAFFSGDHELNHIAHEVAERQSHLIPVVAFPGNLKRSYIAAGIRFTALLIAAGVVQLTPPRASEINQTFIPSDLDGTLEQDGHLAFNFSDALRFTQTDGGARVSPTPGETSINDIQTFGSIRAGITPLEAATEFEIATTQLFGLAVSAVPPTAARGDMYQNEGFYKTSVDRNVVAKAEAKARQLGDEMAKSLAATFYRDEKQYKAFPGFNPATSRNNRAFIESATVTLDLTRDAGRSANAITSALPAMLHSMHDLIEDLNHRGDGIVTRSGPVGAAAEVYFRPG